MRRSLSSLLLATYEMNQPTPSKHRMIAPWICTAAQNRPCICLSAAGRYAAEPHDDIRMIRNQLGSASSHEPRKWCENDMADSADDDLIPSCSSSQARKLPRCPNDRRFPTFRQHADTKGGLLGQVNTQHDWESLHAAVLGKSVHISWHSPGGTRHLISPDLAGIRCDDSSLSSSSESRRESSNQCPTHYDLLTMASNSVRSSTVPCRAILCLI